MFSIFFTIVFIAELIVVHWLISQITRARKVVAAVNLKVLDSRFVIREKCYRTRLILNKLILTLSGLPEKVCEKKKLIDKILSMKILPLILFVLERIGPANIFKFINFILVARQFLKR